MCRTVDCLEIFLKRHFLLQESIAPGDRVDMQGLTRQKPHKLLTDSLVPRVKLPPSGP